MKNVIIDYRASAKTVDALKSMNLNIVKTPQMNTVYTTICGHPDIMIHKMCEGLIVVEPTVYEYFKEKLAGIEILKGKSILSNKYPLDIAYNAARIGKNLLCNKNFTDEVILNYAEKNSINIIHTKQGYAKCSVCIVSDEAIITSDKNIALAAENNKIDVLRVDDSSIKLIGFEHGFIGGATGLINEKLLAVNGDIKLHTDYDKIYDFCKKYGVTIISLNDDKIEDIGSIIVI